MNKSTKIWLNYTVGGVISLILLICIYRQVVNQLHGVAGDAWKHTGPNKYLWLSLLLMLVNIILESTKWYLLTSSVQPLGYFRAFASYLVGIACSIVTPNRVGDYPGRILYLGSGNTFRYINVSVLGVMSQLSGIFIWGLAALIYYNFTFPSLIAHIALGACILANVLIAITYWRFESWLPVLEKIKWLKKFAVYGRLLNRITTLWQVKVLGISILRFAVVTAQYLFLLKWVNVNISPVDGFFMAALFFWTMAVIPSIALGELGVRGTVSLYIFQHFSSNSVGIIAATMGIWLLNLIIPSILGSILIIRMRLLR